MNNSELKLSHYSLLGCKSGQSFGFWKSWVVCWAKKKNRKGSFGRHIILQIDPHLQAVRILAGARDGLKFPVCNFHLQDPTEHLT